MAQSVAENAGKRKWGPDGGGILLPEHSSTIIVSFYRVDHTPGSRDPVLHRATNA